MQCNKRQVEDVVCAWIFCTLNQLPYLGYAFLLLSSSLSLKLCHRTSLLLPSAASSFRSSYSRVVITWRCTVPHICMFVPNITHLFAAFPQGREKKYANAPRPPLALLGKCHVAVVAAFVHAHVLFLPRNRVLLLSQEIPL